MQVRKNRLLFFTLFWYLLAFLAVALPAWAQPNETTEWTWICGSSAIAQPGVYGTLGSPAGGNIPGIGSMHQAGTMAMATFGSSGVMAPIPPAFPAI